MCCSAILCAPLWALECTCVSLLWAPGSAYGRRCFCAHGYMSAPGLAGNATQTHSYTGALNAAGRPRRRPREGLCSFAYVSLQMLLQVLNMTLCELRRGFTLMPRSKVAVCAEPRTASPSPPPAAALTLFTPGTHNRHRGGAAFSNSMHACSQRKKIKKKQNQFL